MLIARTKTYFTSTDYSKCKGEEILIRKCDVSNDMSKCQDILDAADLETTVYKGCKEYEASFIWGQLVGWFKQTVDKPNASLSADRRGTLSVPDLDSFGTVQTSATKKKKKDGSSSDEEIVINSGTRTRKPLESAVKLTEPKKVIKIAYPNKIHQVSLC